VRQRRAHQLDEVGALLRRKEVVVQPGARVPADLFNPRGARRAAATAPQRYWPAHQA